MNNFFDFLVFVLQSINKEKSISFKENITISKKENSDDCSVQSIQGVLAYYGEHTTSQELYTEFKNKGIISHNKGLIYKKLKDSFLLKNYSIQYFRYLPNILLSYLCIYKKTPCLVSIQQEGQEIGHIVTVLEIKTYHNLLQTITIGDSKTGTIQEFSRQQRNQIYNQRGCILYTRKPKK